MFVSLAFKFYIMSLDSNSQVAYQLMMPMHSRPTGLDRVIVPPSALITSSDTCDEHQRQLLKHLKRKTI